MSRVVSRLGPGGLCEGGGLCDEVSVKGDGDPPPFCIDMAATEAGGTHPTGMHSCFACK